MTIKEAYADWKTYSKNKELYINTKSAFSRAWAGLSFKLDVSEVKMDTLAESLWVPKISRKEKTSAASVMIQVINHGRKLENRNELTYTYEDVVELMDSMEHGDEVQVDPCRIPKENADGEVTGLTSELTSSDPTKVVPETQTVVKKGKAPMPIAQLDPVTLKVVKIFESRGQAEKELNAKNLKRAVDNCVKDKGFYWCNPSDIDSFRPSRAVTKPKPKSVKKSNVTKATKTSKKLEPKIKGDKDIVNALKKEADIVLILSKFTDDELANELHRRGFEGELKKVTVNILKV